MSMCGSNKPSGECPVLPVDLVINIMSKLRMKFMAKCRCISKLWSSVIRRTNNNLSFPITLPDPPPRILFTIECEGGLFFYTLPQPLNPDVKTSLAATFHHKTSGKDLYEVCQPIQGLVCRQHTDEENYTFAVISNPITGESLTLPMEKFSSKARKEKYYFGYDPIDKQFKVLRITWWSFTFKKCSSEYHVLTIGTENENLLWREVQCCTTLYPQNESGICIDGVIYYPSEMEKGKLTIVCFDVRSEKFNLVSVGQDLATKIDSSGFTLVEYKGKLGAYKRDIYRDCFELWVLEDVEQHIWSKRVYQIPLRWFKKISHVRPAGMIGSCEMVFVFDQSKTSYACPFFILYYNLESNTFTKVKLEGLLFEEFSQYSRVHAFTNYVEDVKLM
ncbi:PREDICTED: putative F-box protein At1g53550 [Camelina sativa]|uniref:F-box protein At1g53550 n=1 Tax=Camelina sativa TaxID=90675 RepID=A0ABM0VZ69_CAMSA|nr:PREDICTED: putative F-box protein At1g53550 [Camelina sativa]